MNFNRKSRWVLDGHKTLDPVCSTYSGVFSREIISITLTYTALNGLEVCAADIQNSYLQAPSSKKTSYVALNLASKMWAGWLCYIEHSMVATQLDVISETT